MIFRLQTQLLECGENKRMISTAEIRATSTYFRDSIRTGYHYFEESDDDMMNHQILDCIGALIYTQNIEKSKRKMRRKNEDCITTNKRRVFSERILNSYKASGS